MFISELRLHCFRSYKEAQVTLATGLNVLVGPNNPRWTPKTGQSWTLENRPVR